MKSARLTKSCVASSESFLSYRHQFDCPLIYGRFLRCDVALSSLVMLRYRLAMIDDAQRQKLATMLRKTASLFDMPPDAIVKVQKEGGPLLPIRLDDLLKRIERGTEPC